MVLRRPMQRWKRRQGRLNPRVSRLHCLGWEMHLKLPKTPCWNLPEGNHTATCLDARINLENKNGKANEYLMLVFEVDIDDDDNVQYLAKRKYELPIKAGTPLLNDLNAWLGAEFLKKNRYFDSETLKGRTADISLVHIYNANYRNPFVHIQSIHAPGSLVVADEGPVIRSSDCRFRLEDVK